MLVSQLGDPGSIPG